MVEPRNDEMSRRTEDTTDPRNPPNSVLNKSARRAAVGSYFVPVVVLFLVIAGALAYWSRRPDHSDTDRGERSAIGTIGSTEGAGNDIRPKLDSPRDEIRFRGGDLAPITATADLSEVNPRTMAGRQVEIGDAKVDSVNGTTLWVRDGDRKYAVVAPAGGASVKSGDKVSVSGHVEADDKGETRIIADRVQVK
jgi:hypothetical protein